MTASQPYHDLPVLELAFPGPLRDRLVTAIRNGVKTATSSLVVERELKGVALPQVGERQVVIDSAGAPAAIIELTAVHRCRMADIPVPHLIADGGNSDRAAWVIGHERYWHSDEYRAWIGVPNFRVNDDTEVLCISFQLLERL